MKYAKFKYPKVYRKSVKDIFEDLGIYKNTELSIVLSGNLGGIYYYNN